MASKKNKKINGIELIVSDVDGVLTDGKIYLDAEGREFKIFNARDAFRVEIWLRAGKKMVWFTGRKSAGVIKRAGDLGVGLLFKQDIQGDLLAYIQEKYNVVPDKIMYLGDDWSDLYYMNRVGCAAAPASASGENKKIADLVTKAKGGDGVLAEVIEFIMRAQGIWKKEVDAYLEKFIL
ncbi:MAG: HAD hydrolase family protein [Candidatus Yanofskybacteria bacterium]|nr:HAD hydrolase family protein [Candidatus Yanofskybacteria bacterium]